MHERGAAYLTRTEPVATWMATLDATTLAVLDLRPAPDPSPSLYGWSIASDRHGTYLFAQCHRQFGFGFLGHDPCTAEVRVARLPRGDLDAIPRYWDGRSWVADPARAVDIAPPTGPGGEARVINPMQITFAHGRWIAVTKEGDWWGSTIYLDRASRPTGPWTTTATITPEPLGDEDEMNTYFASVVVGALAHGRHRPQQQPLGRSPVGGLPPDVPRRAAGDVEPPPPARTADPATHLVALSD